VFQEPLRQASIAGASRTRCTLVFFAASAVLIVASALLRTAIKDESQYVAAIAMMRQGWPYLDFAYLQTPLQPLLFSPLSLLSAGLVYAGLRTANALCAFATLVVLCTSLRSRASSRSILIALAALVCSQPFLLAASLARNDALPMLLIASAVAALLVGVDRRSPLTFAIAGLFLGLATSAKISAALPAAGAVLFLALRVRAFGWRCFAAFAAGSFVGLLPCFAFALAAPSQFRFDVFAYSLDAPAQWWNSVGKAGDLEPLHRILRLIGLAAEGSILVAVAAALFDRRKSHENLLLDLMIIGGVVGSYMPEPAYAQYLVPLLPPLFARFALALDAAHTGRLQALTALTVAGSLTGVGFAASHVNGRIAVAEAARTGPKVAALARGGAIATLSPEYVAGARANVDRRFAAGPFLFRTSGTLAGDAERYGQAVSSRDVERLLDSDRPSLVLVGRETVPHRPRYPQGLDAPLAAWARSRDYRPVAVGNGFLVYVRPNLSG
jgi:hypothetical protein